MTSLINRHTVIRKRITKDSESSKMTREDVRGWEGRRPGRIVAPLRRGGSGSGHQKEESDDWTIHGERSRRMEREGPRKTAAADRVVLEHSLRGLYAHHNEPVIRYCLSGRVPVHGQARAPLEVGTGREGRKCVVRHGIVERMFIHAMSRATHTEAVPRHKTSFA